MTSSQRNRDQDYKDLLEIIGRCRAEALDTGDRAVIRSAVRHLDDVALNSLLEEGFECQELLDAVFDVVRSDPEHWPNFLLTRLTESLLFLGLDRQADTIAEELRRREPANPEVIRLWAISAGAPEATIRRFVAGLSKTDNRSLLISHAQEYARRNLDNELITILEEALARLATDKRGDAQ